MPSKRFSRWKYMEEWLQGEVVPGVDFTLRLEKDVSHVEEYSDGTSETYIYDEYVVEWEV